MINLNVFPVRLSLSGKTTAGNILIHKYNMFYCEGDDKRFDYCFQAVAVPCIFVVNGA